MTQATMQHFMSISNANEQDVAFLIAATINLQNETLRRITGEIRYSPNDVLDLFMMIEIAIDKGTRNKNNTIPTPKRHAPLPSEFAPKNRLTDEDKLKAVEEAVRP